MAVMNEEIEVSEVLHVDSLPYPTRFYNCSMPSMSLSRFSSSPSIIKPFMMRDLLNVSTRFLSNHHPKYSQIPNPTRPHALLQLHTLDLRDTNDLLRHAR